MNQQIRSYCNQCHSETIHNVIHSHQKNILCIEESGFYAYRQYKIIECCGCEKISFYESYDDDSSSEDDEPSVTLYPPRISRKKPDFIRSLNKEYISLFDEIYKAISNECERLACMGIRSLIDLYINKKVGDQGNFYNGIKKLLSEGIITERQSLFINKIIVEAGNASIHRQFKPDLEILELLLDTVENLLHEEMLVPQLEEIKDKIPERPPLSKKTQTKDKSPAS